MSRQFPLKAKQPHPLLLTEAARQQVRWPATMLFVAGLLTLACAVVVLWTLVPQGHVLDPSTGNTQLYGGTELLWRIGSILAIPAGFIIILGAAGMNRLQSRGLAVAAGVFCLIPLTPSWLLTLPIGAWVLSVLARLEVKAAFPRKQPGVEPIEKESKPETLDATEAIRQQVRGPAIALLIAGLLSLVSGPITGLWILAEYRLVDSWEVGDWRLGTTVLTIWLIAQAVAITIAALVIAAALNMKRLKSRGLALTAAILAMIPLTLSWPLTLPIAIWVLSILTRSEVKEAFPSRPIDLSRKGKWNAFCIAALLISLVGIFFSIREMDPGEDVPVRIIWALSIAISAVFACIGLWQHSRYQGMKGKGFDIAALVISLAALIGFFVTIYYPVGW